MSDVGNPAILDCQPLGYEEIAEILQVKEKSGVWDAVEKMKIPRPYDNNGPGGTARWFMGQIRAWYQHDCDLAIKRDQKARDSMIKAK